MHPQPPTPVAEKEKPKSDLVPRLLTSAVLVPTVIYVIVLGGLPYLALTIVLTLLGQREFYRLIEDKGAHPLVAYGLAAGAALPVVAYLGNEYHATLIMTATLLVVMVRQVGKAQIAEALVSISGTFFGVFYVGWLFSHTIVLRDFHRAASAKYGVDALNGLGFPEEVGIYLMLFTATAIVWSDAGAYFAGHAWGKRKLAPRISPNKSVEGAIGAVVTGTVGGLAVKLLFDTVWPDYSAPLSWRAAAGMAFVLANVAIVGDLVESLLKRDAQAKDAGQLLPGMGGVLDRLDSPLLAIPVMYYMMLLYVWVRIQ